MDKDSLLTATATADAFVEILPEFPESAYVGIAGEIADFYAEYLETPRQFLYMDCLAFMGSCLSPYVRTPLWEEPRLYVVKVAPYGTARKSMSQDLMQEFFAGMNTDVIGGTGSGEGLLEAVDGRNVVLMPDEFSLLVKKGRIEASSLPERLTELFNKNSTSYYLKGKVYHIEDARLTICSATTPELYMTMFNSQGTSGGLVSRLFVVLSGEVIIKPPPTIPRAKEHRLRERMKELIQREVDEADKIEDKVFRLTWGPGAEEAWMEYYRPLRLSGDRLAERLDSYGLRLVTLFAVSRGEDEISQDTVSRVVELLEYQRAARRLVQPVEAESLDAALAQHVLRVLANAPGVLVKRSALYRAVHAERYGPDCFTRVLRGLGSIGHVEKENEGRATRYRATREGLQTHLGFAWMRKVPQLPQGGDGT